MLILVKAPFLARIMGRLGRRQGVETRIDLWGFHGGIPKSP